MGVSGVVLVPKATRRKVTFALFRGSYVEVADSYPVFVCVAALAILDRLDVVDYESLGWWLCERQLPNGGLNGRPEKLEDVEWTTFQLALT